MHRRYFKECHICGVEILYPTVHLQKKHKLLTDSTEYQDALMKSKRTKKSRTYSESEPKKTLDKRALRRLYRKILTGQIVISDDEKKLLYPYRKLMRRNMYNAKLTEILRQIHIRTN